VGWLPSYTMVLSILRNEDNLAGTQSLNAQMKTWLPHWADGRVGWTCPNMYAMLPKKRRQQ
jgi:hypothetical protein